MIKFKPVVDYRKFRLHKLNTPEFSHLKLLIFWPIFGILFFVLERVLTLDYHIVYSVIDESIPFCEFFVIPYYFWFVFLVGMLLYSLMFNIETFKRYMLYIMITYSFTILIYIVFPTAQELRPLAFTRNNILTNIVSRLYSFDTNTNVCPSMHVIGSLAVFFAAWNDKKFSAPFVRLCFAVATILISVSTVFLKQHSIIDIIFAVVLSFACYPLVYRHKHEKLAETMA